MASEGASASGVASSEVPSGVASYEVATGGASFVGESADKES